MFLFLSLNFIFFYAAKIVLLYAEPLWLSLIENDLLHLVMYGNKNIHEYKNNSCDCHICQCFLKVWSTSFLTIIKTILISSSILLVNLLFKEVRCYVIILTVLLGYRFCTVLFYIVNAKTLVCKVWSFVRMIAVE